MANFVPEQVANFIPESAANFRRNGWPTWSGVRTCMEWGNLRAGSRRQIRGRNQRARFDLKNLVRKRRVGLYKTTMKGMVGCAGQDPLLV
jgi:hypothetical protein